MFENYIYMDEEALDNYLSDLCSPTKIKGKSLNFEITLPFIKISATGEFSRDISSLSKRQKCILFERLLEKNETVFFGSEDKEFAHDMQRNTIVRFRSKLKIPEMIELINGANSFLSGKFSDFMVTEIEKSSDDKNQTQILLSVLSERQSTVPVIFDEKNRRFFGNCDRKYRKSRRNRFLGYSCGRRVHYNCKNKQELYESLESPHL